MAHVNIAKAAALYFPPSILNQGGGDIGARCGKCIMYLSDTGECGQVFKGSSHKVDGDRGVCGGMFPGKPMKRYDGKKEIHPLMRILPQDIAGYVSYGPTYCGWCKNYEGKKRSSLETSTCSKVGLKSDPGGVSIAFSACCNVFEPDKKADIKADMNLQPKARVEGGLESLAKG